MMQDYDVLAPYGAVLEDYERLRAIESRIAFERALAEERIRSQQESLRAKEERLRFIAHELRNPLTAIMGQIQLLQRHRDDPRRLDQSLRHMEHAVQALARLSANLLEIARSDAGALGESAEALDAVWAARAAMDELAANAEQAGVTLTLAAVAGLPPIRAGRAVLATIIGNLLGNAIKYSYQGGQVRMTLAANGVWVRLAIADEGIGIPAADLPRIFEPYYRAGNSTSVEGVGLGLAVARAATERLGGRLELESVEGAGTTVTVQLPLAGPG
jgi:signal transduction histidine kinase